MDDDVYKQLAAGSGRLIGRRAMLQAMLAAGATAAVMESVFGTPVVAHATGPPTTAAGVVALAQSCLGKTLAQLQATVMTESPWVSYWSEWCAVFASWLVRGASGGIYTASSSTLYNLFLPASSPAPGDIIWYPVPGHTGIVAEVSGSTITTIEGNVPDGSFTTTKVKQYSPPWRGGYYFSRPNYVPTTSIKSGESDMLMLRNLSYSPGYQFALFAPGFWYEWTSSSGGGFANDISLQISGGATGAAGVTNAEWLAIKAAAQSPVPVAMTS